MIWMLGQMCMCSSTVAGNAVMTSMAITGGINQATKGLLDKAKENVLGHSILPLEGSLSGDCDVKKNGKWSCIYAVGSHEYQMVCTRLDIASTDVGMLDGFDRGLHTYVQVFVDFDYAMGRSITRYGFMILGCAGSLKANLQHMEALSTTEAEYMALTEAVKEAIWLRGLLKELGVELNKVTVNCDNQGAIHLSRNHVFLERTKHINVRYHFIREVLEAKTVEVLNVGTEHNAADAFTKLLSNIKTLILYSRSDQAQVLAGWTRGGCRSAQQQKVTTIDAVKYLNFVQYTFQDKQEKYDMFTYILGNFKEQRIDTAFVVTSLKLLFKGHNDLIAGLNTVLSKRSKIIITEDGEASAMRTTTEFKEAKPF
nr:hypothetical protein [Tanacetum cinerariifolium]